MTRPDYLRLETKADVGVPVQNRITALRTFEAEKLAALEGIVRAHDHATDHRRRRIQAMRDRWNS